ncbi:MAG: translocation protein TolB [Desulfovibrio sp.]|jgi:TolB protein|nr:translocation protein TolB [Desulfovibrio sp.]
MIKNTVSRKRIGLRAAFLACLLFLLPARAQADGPFTVQIVGAGGGVVNVLQANPIGDTGRAAALRKAIDSNLGLMPFLRVQSPAAVPGGAGVPSASGQGVDFKRFSLAQINLLVTSAWQGPSQVELICFSVADGSFMFGNRYTVGAGENDLLDVADAFCADFLDKVIGRGDFFRSVMAFVKSEGPNKKDIWSVQPNGRRLVRLTNLRGEALSPTWSPDGRRVLFTHIDKRSHGLGVCDTVSKTVQRIKFPGNTVIGPVYMPDGRVAVSLTDGRNPSIFLLGHNLEKQGRLDDSAAIDVSPSVDTTGSLMAFTSGRLGSPQVFLKDLRSGAVRRISQAGSYNTDPSISPDGTLIAYARQEGGGHRIYVQDLVTGQERQVSFGPGSDEEPAFAPDSYFIAFMSTRGGSRGIYVTTRNGGEARRLPTGPGDAAFPAWGPSRKR